MNVGIKVVKGYSEEPDRQYRTLVMLQRSDRPKYWIFHCPNCQQPMAHLSNRDIIAISDFYDHQSTTNGAVGVRCPGAYCKRWYYFQLN